MTRHIKNYTKVRNAINKAYRNKLKSESAELNLLSSDIWQQYDRFSDMSESERNNRIAFLNRRLTEPKVFKNGKTKFARGSIRKQWDDDLKRLDAADKAGRVLRIKCSVQWKRSHQWGLCPACESWVQYDGDPQDKVNLSDAPNDYVMLSTHYNPRTYASGCGYDKLSAVIEDGICCPAVDRLIIENSDTWKTCAVQVSDGFPNLCISGKGLSVLRSLFVAHGCKPPIPGFTWQHESGSTWDFLSITRENHT